MTNKQHPITPPLNLVEQWWDAVPGTFTYLADEMQLATAAAQWGADQELDVCCEWLSWRISRHMSEQLRDTRRAKPLTLKQQALTILDDCSDRLDGAHENILRKALEQLND